ncbi:WhiB family transcriptional regulator [Streptomyces sp. SID4917]|uniref:WhiB family transcriptional regulator n=1 Tax=Streptomyces sp. MnatMP-M17 TaxID=1839780 RepID=UPI000B848A00|nr:WhiB family transcriptional regulator [Streptomyces sp. SID4917]
MTRRQHSPDGQLVPCARVEPEVFHSDELVGLAKSTCAGCPLGEACRLRARTNREWGTWGGETSRERANAGYAPHGWTRPNPAAL